MTYKKCNVNATYVLVLLSRDHFFNCDKRFIRNMPIPRATIYNNNPLFTFSGVIVVVE